jgi:hypothetical protein
MARKKYIGKTCAYCSREGVSEVREHVICKEFFLERDRDNLPMVPACEECNTEKSKLETYALAILPLGSRHQDSLCYVERNMSRRLRQNPTLNRQIAEGTTKVREKQGGLLLPTSAIPVDDERIDKLMATIVRGLFMHEFGFALHKNWDVRVTMFRPDVEGNMIGQAKGLLGLNPIFVTRNWTGHLHLRGGQQFDISEPVGLAIYAFRGANACRRRAGAASLRRAAGRVRNPA